MIVFGSRPRTLLGVLLLAGLLVAGRTALATHPYDHDLATPDAKCELCELSHVSKDDLVQPEAASFGLTIGLPRPCTARPTTFVSPLTAYFSRAPPSTHS